MNKLNVQHINVLVTTLEEKHMSNLTIEYTIPVLRRIWAVPGVSAIAWCSGNCHGRPIERNHRHSPGAAVVEHPGRYRHH